MGSSFFEKSIYNWEDLERLISDGIEESLHLDYKAAKALDKSDLKRKEISKDVSSFANSAGGIIIYGIEEEGAKPTGFSYIDGNEYNKEWLENVIDGNIQQKIHGIEIFALRKDGDIRKSVYIVKVPVSPNSPHICSDKKYYRRYNFKSVPMEEYEVRLLYFKQSSSEVDFESVLVVQKGNELRNQNKVRKREVSVYVKNNSNSMVKHCKVEAYFQDVDGLDVSFSYPSGVNVNHKNLKNRENVLTSFNDSPIFPQEEYCILRFELWVSFQHLRRFDENAKLAVRLFNTSSIKTKIYDLSKPGENKVSHD